MEKSVLYPNIENESCFVYNNYYLDHFNERALRLFRVDHIRLLRLIEISFYIVLFSIVTLTVGLSVNSLFPRADITKSSALLIFEVLVNMLVLGIAVFYIRKIVMLVPFPLGQAFGYCPSNQNQIGISMMIGQGVVLFSSQIRLQSKVRILAGRWD